jgi:hypothetical protein
MASLSRHAERAQACPVDWHLGGEGGSIQVRVPSKNFYVSDGSQEEPIISQSLLARISASRIVPHLNIFGMNHMIRPRHRTVILLPLLGSLRGSSQSITIVQLPCTSLLPCSRTGTFPFDEKGRASFTLR